MAHDTGVVGGNALIASHKGQNTTGRCQALGHSNHRNLRHLDSIDQLPGPEDRTTRAIDEQGDTLGLNLFWHQVILSDLYHQGVDGVLVELVVQIQHTILT